MGKTIQLETSLPNFFSAARDSAETHLVDCDCKRGLLVVSLSGIAGSAVAGADPLTALLAGAQRIGGVYRLDYDRATVITDDFVKRKVGGVPRHGFLLAAATVPNQ